MSAPVSAAPPDKRRVARSFGAAADRYDGVAGLQRSAGETLLGFGEPRPGEPNTILDVGAGTGFPASRLRRRHPEAELVLLDLAEGMLRKARERLAGDGACRFLCADAEALPLPDRSVDLVFSNLALQWCGDLGAAFGEFRRVLRPGGTLLFSTFGPATLGELRAAWAAVDAYTHVNDFLGANDVSALLERAGFAGGEVRAEMRRVAYPDVWTLMRELKDLGARNLTSGRPRHLTGKRKVRDMIAAYEAQMSEGRIRAGFEVVYGRAA